jgi:type II secretory pathway pseudopilin PulG
MESVLIVITLVSLGMTIALAVILVRLVRDERRRSDARVAVLREMAEAAVERQPTESAQPSAISSQPSAISYQPSAKNTSADVPRLPDDVDLDYGYDNAGSGAELFIRPEPSTAWPRRLAVVGILALLVTAVGMAVRSRSEQTSATTTVATGATTGTASDQQSALLELLSLKQTQDNGALTITGLVQNPRDGAVLSKISATALVFSADGTFLASGRAPLDYTVLRPGDESAFVISVPVNAPVARYRVGFRSEDGRVIGHIDRRTATTMASTSDALRLGRVRGTS